MILGILQIALLKRKLEPGIVHRSNIGSVGCTSDYIAVLTAYRVPCSMSRKADF